MPAKNPPDSILTYLRIAKNAEQGAIPFPAGALLFHFKEHEKVFDRLFGRAMEGAGASTMKALSRHYGHKADHLSNCKSNNAISLELLVELLRDAKMEIPDIDGHVGFVTLKPASRSAPLMKAFCHLLKASRFVERGELDREGLYYPGLVGLTRGEAVAINRISIDASRGGSIAYFWVNGDPEQDLKFSRTLVHHFKSYGFRAVAAENAVGSFRAVSGSRAKFEKTLKKLRKLGMR